MAEDINDHKADDPIDPLSNDPADESLSPATTSIIPTVQEKETMEVHHHAHSGHGKKTWRHYFWEFLMLFLAVVCGFLAEWKLEHVIEHSRENEFMESMVVDIKSDSAKLVYMKSKFEFVGTQIDSLIPFLNEPEQLNEHATEIYQHQVYLNLYVKWIYSDRTIDQLKNSGTFRLIRNKAVSNAIISYDGFIRNFIDDMQKSLIQTQWQGINDAGNEIFRSSVFRKYFKSGNFNAHSVELPASPYFLTTDKTVLQKFINKLDQYAVSLEWFTDNINRALVQNKSLDSIIRKEYHLKF